MIPVTAPNIFISGVPVLQVNVLSSVSGLIKGVDYIPVVETSAAGAYLNTYGNGINIGALSVNPVSSGVKWIDYVPVFIVSATGSPWVDYIPVNGSGGGGGGGSFILMENGTDFILMEDGTSFILMES